MPPRDDGDVVSNVEIILPQKVIEKCYELEKGTGAEFNSVNSHLGTSSKIKLLKQEDDSIKINFIVSAVKSKKISENVENAGENGMDDIHDVGDFEAIPDSKEDKKRKVLSVSSEPSGSRSQKSRKLSKSSSLKDVEETRSFSHRHSQVQATRKSKRLSVSKKIVSYAKTMKYGYKYVDIKNEHNEGVKNKVDLSDDEENDMEEDNQGDGEDEKDGILNDTVPQSPPPRNMRKKDIKIHVKAEKADVRDNSAVSSSVSTSSANGPELDPPFMGKLTFISKKPKVSKPQVVDRSQMKRPNYKREHNVSCFVCPTKLKDYDNVFEHFKLKHADHPEYNGYIQQIRSLMKAQCHHCGKIFARKEMLNQHVKVMHQELKKVTCPHCNLVIRSEKHLKDHNRRMHNHQDKKHLCHLCPASFRLPEYLSAHIKSVHNEGPAVACGTCGRKYASRKLMHNHMIRVHGEKKHLCMYCSKRFTTAPNMRRHIQLIHEQPNEKGFSCSYCSRKFNLKCNLKEHEQTIHLKQFPLHCDVCNLGFRRKQAMKLHKETNCPGLFMNLFQGNEGGSQPIFVLPQGEDGSEPLTVEDLQRLLVDYVPTQKTVVSPKKIAPKLPSPPSAPTTPIRIESANNQKTDTGVQYIVATPEMLKEFGVTAPDPQETFIDDMMEDDV